MAVGNWVVVRKAGCIEVVVVSLEGFDNKVDWKVAADFLVRKIFWECGKNGDNKSLPY